MGQRLQIEWQESADQLQLLYRLEPNAQRRIRLQAFWQLRRGRRIQGVAESIGVCYRTIQYWVAWYRGGGVATDPRSGERVRGKAHRAATAGIGGESGAELV